MRKIIRGFPANNALYAMLVIRQLKEKRLVGRIGPDNEIHLV